jgi:hypothetical protein
MRDSNRAGGRVGGVLRIQLQSSYSLKQEEKRQVVFWCCGRNVGCMPFWEGGSVLHLLDDAPISVLLRLGCLSSVRLVSL